MSTSRRDFLKKTGLALGAVTLAPWVLEAEAKAAAIFQDDKNKLADLALSMAQKLGASYADIRINRYRTEAVNTRERQVLNLSRNQNFGFGVRVLVNGTWGFAASPDVNEKAVAQAVNDAVAIAKANSMYQRKKVTMAPVEKVTANWKSHFQKDPFDVSIDDKIQFLMKLNEAALGVTGVNFVNSSMQWVNEQKFLATSDGSRIEQYLIRGNPNFSVTAINRATGDFQLHPCPSLRIKM